jgi:serine protease AprX
VLAVGALDTTAPGQGAGHVAAFSRWSPNGRTVDLVAPGVSLQGLRVPGSAIDAEVGPDGGIGTRFVRGSGTSEAAAVTSGAAALLLSARPGLSPDQVKAILTGAADPLGDTARAQGRGALDLAGTLDAPVRAGMTQRFTQSRGSGRYRGDQPGGSGASWAGASWAGASWAGASWAGASWAGASWSGASWAGASWAGASWSGAAWAGERWS